jgi:uncharacterized protein
MNILIVAAVALILNIFLGLWRRKFKKFTFKWWLIIHASIPLIIPLRILLNTPYAYTPLFIALAVAGQFIGARILLAHIKKSILVRAAFILLGTISLALAVIGIFLPMLPTTPFLLLTAFLYMRGSPYLHDKLLSNKYLGRHIREYQEHKTVSVRVKITSITVLWVSVLCSVFFVVESLYINIVQLLVAAAVTLHLARMRTHRQP